MPRRTADTRTAAWVAALDKHPEPAYVQLLNDIKTHVLEQYQQTAGSEGSLSDCEGCFVLFWNLDCVAHKVCLF